MSRTPLAYLLIFLVESYGARLLIVWWWFFYIRWSQLQKLQHFENWRVKSMHCHFLCFSKILFESFGGPLVVAFYVEVRDYKNCSIFKIGRLTSLFIIFQKFFFQSFRQFKFDLKLFLNIIFYFYLQSDQFTLQKNENLKKK